MMEGTGDLGAALALASARARIQKKRWARISQRHDRKTTGQDGTGRGHVFCRLCHQSKNTGLRCALSRVQRYRDLAVN